MLRDNFKHIFIANSRFPRVFLNNCEVTTKFYDRKTKENEKYTKQPVISYLASGNTILIMRYQAADSEGVNVLNVHQHALSVNLAN